MRKSFFLILTWIILSYLGGCSYVKRNDPDLLYSCIDSFPVNEGTPGDGSFESEEKEQLKAFEFCIKRI